jgi:hypothetical protein
MIRGHSYFSFPISNCLQFCPYHKETASSAKRRINPGLCHIPFRRTTWTQHWLHRKAQQSLFNLEKWSWTTSLSCIVLDQSELRLEFKFASTRVRHFCWVRATFWMDSVWSIWGWDGWSADWDQWFIANTRTHWSCGRGED